MFARALLNNAAAVILAHNHPGGSLEPSPHDLAVTDQLKKAGDILDIRLLDHIIVGGLNADETYSFAEHGLIPSK